MANSLLDYFSNEILVTIFDKAFPEIGNKKESVMGVMRMREVSLLVRLLIESHLVSMVKSLCTRIVPKLYPSQLLLFTGVKSLGLFSAVNVDDKTLSQMTWLKQLSFMNKNETITEEGLVQLTNLASLMYTSPTKSQTKALRSLRQLDELLLRDNKRVADVDLLYLTQLRSLYLDDNLRIRGLFLNTTNFPRLGHLSIAGERGLTMVTFSTLALQITSLSLTDLSAFDSIRILNRMTSLRELSLKRVPVYDETLQQLTSLVTLSLSECPCVTDDGLSTLTRLENLSLGRQGCCITAIGLNYLKGSLVKIDIFSTDVILSDLLSLGLLQSVVYTRHNPSPPILSAELNAIQSLQQRGVKVEMTIIADVL